jgi:hypothetical protein
VPWSLPPEACHAAAIPIGGVFPAGPALCSTIGWHRQHCGKCLRNIIWLRSNRFSECLERSRLSTVRLSLRRGTGFEVFARNGGD